jgi:hypothetical protein
VPTERLQDLLEYGNLDWNWQFALVEELSRRIEQKERHLHQKAPAGLEAAQKAIGKLSTNDQQSLLRWLGKLLEEP